MTSSSKPVQRLTDISYPVLYRKPRRIVVRIEGELLRFREHGRRELFDFPIDEAFKVAVKCKSGFRLFMMPCRDMAKARKVRVRRTKL